VRSRSGGQRDLAELRIGAHVLERRAVPLSEAIKAIMSALMLDA
jgi:hypothetical protein